MRVSVGRGAGGDHYSWRLLWKVIGGADKSAGGWHGGRAGARPSREAQEARPTRKVEHYRPRSDSMSGRRSAGALHPRVVEHLLDDRARLSPAPPARTSDPTPRGPAARHASRTW